MKKFALLLGIGLTMGLTACDDMLPNPQPTVNPELELFSKDDLVLSQNSLGETTPINLQTLADQGEMAAIAEITTLQNFPATCELSFKVELSTSDDFAKSVTIDATQADNMVVTPASTINTAIYDTFTHDPSEITLYSRISAYASEGTSVMRLGGADYLYGEYTYKFLPFTPAKQLDSSYFLKYRTSATGAWAYMQMDKAAPSESVYDNPTFTVQVDVEDAGFEWMVVSATSHNAGTDADVFGVAAGTEADTAAGDLVEGEAATPAAIDKANPYVITVDVLNNTYKVNLAFEYLYVPGSATGEGYSRAMKLFTKDFVTYEGSMRLYVDWYLSAQASDQGAVFMVDGDEKVTETGVVSGALTQLANAEGTKMTAGNGLYYIKANLGTMTFSATPVNSIAIIGAFNDWNTETALDLTTNARFTTWTLKDAKLTAGEFKFCVDHAWDLSYGGSEDNLEQNGGNLTLAEDGTYDITIDYTKQPNTVKIVKK